MSDIPSPDGPLYALLRYAHTIQGYNVLDQEQGVDLLYALKVRTSKDELQDAGSRRLRLGLFFAARALHWESGWEEGESETAVLMRDIVRALQSLELETDGEGPVWIPACPFCESGEANASMQSDHALVIPDKYPVSDGHTLVVPRQHAQSLFDLAACKQSDVWALVAKVRNELMTLARVEGITIGVNDGLAAGQHLPHAHVHIIPRRRGDVPNPKGGVRWVMPEGARRWSRSKAG